MLEMSQWMISVEHPYGVVFVFVRLDPEQYSPMFAFVEMFA